MLDAEKMLAEMLSKEIAKNIDSEILNNLVNMKYNDRVRKMKKILEIANNKKSSN